MKAILNALKTWRLLWAFVDGKTSHIDLGFATPPEDPQALKKEYEKLAEEHKRVLGEWYRDCEELHKRIVGLEEAKAGYDLETERSIVTALVMFIRSEWKTRNTSQASRMYVKQSVEALRKIWDRE